VLNHIDEALALFNGAVLNYFVIMRKANTTQSRRRSRASAVESAESLPCTSAALRRAARQLGNLYDEVISPVGLKGTQIALLGRIDRLTEEEGPSLQELAKELGVQISAVTHALRPLVESGLVEITTDLKDKRIKHATLSDHGRKRLQEGGKLWAEANGRVETVLGARTSALLRALADDVSSPEFVEAYKAGRPLEKRTARS
jgi:DNA-binding MarR family transcriptional regulator